MTTSDAVHLSHSVNLPYETDAGLGPNAHIGLIVTSNDQTLSYEARRMLTVPGIALYESRLLSVRPKDGELNVGELRGMPERIVASVRLINTIRAPDVVALGCTSGAMVMGHAELLQRVREIFPGAEVTDPLTGLLSSLTALNVTRVCFISPYPRQVADMMMGELRAAGHEVPVFGAFSHEGSNVSADAPFIAQRSIADAVLHLGRSDLVDVVFVACTQLRGAELIEDLEKDLAKPVITSNQALCWHALRLARYSNPVHGWGTLFRSDMSRD
jgi:maleate isomerase